MHDKTPQNIWCFKKYVNWLQRVQQILKTAAKVRFFSWKISNDLPTNRTWQYCLAEKPPGRIFAGDLTVEAPDRNFLEAVWL